MTLFLNIRLKISSSLHLPRSSWVFHLKKKKKFQFIWNNAINGSKTPTTLCVSCAMQMGTQPKGGRAGRNPTHNQQIACPGNEVEISSRNTFPWFLPRKGHLAKVPWGLCIQRGCFLVCLFFISLTALNRLASRFVYKRTF